MFVIGYHCPADLRTTDVVVAKLRQLVAVEVVKAVDWDGERRQIRCSTADSCVALRFDPDGWLNLLLESEVGPSANHIASNVNTTLFFAGADVCGIALPESLWWVDHVLSERQPASHEATLAWRVIGLWCEADLEAVRGNMDQVPRLREQAHAAAAELAGRTPRCS